MNKDQEKARIEQTINMWIERVTELINGVKSIKNYREDTLCVDYHRSLLKVRNDYFNLLLKTDELTEKQIKNGEFDKMVAEQDKRYLGLLDTLKWLKNRPHIIKWD